MRGSPSSTTFGPARSTCDPGETAALIRPPGPGLFSPTCSGPTVPSIPGPTSSIPLPLAPHRRRWPTVSSWPHRFVRLGAQVLPRRSSTGLPRIPAPRRRGWGAQRPMPAVWLRVRRTLPAKVRLFQFLGTGGANWIWNSYRPMDTCRGWWVQNFPEWWGQKAPEKTAWPLLHRPNRWLPRRLHPRSRRSRDADCRGPPPAKPRHGRRARILVP
jgi:hypothetical protein